MKAFKKIAAQGDCLIIKRDELPDGLAPKQPINGKHIIAHSGTGHHHVMESKGVDIFQAANDPMALWVVVNNPTALVHNRSFDTHAPIMFDPGIYEIKRQREYTPEGWQRVKD